MPKFEISFYRTVGEYAHHTVEARDRETAEALVEVEAGSLEEARQKALDVPLHISEWETCEYDDDRGYELMSISDTDGTELWDKEMGEILYGQS